MKVQSISFPMISRRDGLIEFYIASLTFSLLWPILDARK